MSASVHVPYIMRSTPASRQHPSSRLSTISQDLFQLQLSKARPATMSDPVKEQIAQDKYGKGFEELDSRERQSVGGIKGGQARKEQMADEHGGDATAGYKEMGAKGGAVTNEDTGKKA